MLVLLRYLKYKLIDSPDPSRELLYYAARVTLAGLIGLILYEVIPIQQPGWILLGSVFLTACSRGKTHQLRCLLFACAALYVLAVSFFITLLAGSSWFFLLAIVIIVLLGYWFVPVNFDAGVVIVLNIILTLVIDAYPGDLIVAWHRFIATAIGVGIAFISAYFFFPYRPRAVIKRLNHVIERKNIFYLQWVFTDYICGNITSQRLDAYQHDVFTHIQEEWQLLLSYPDPVQLKLLDDCMEFFGQIGVLARLLFEPIEQNSLVRIFSSLDEFRKDFFEISKEKYMHLSLIHI